MFALSWPGVSACVEALRTPKNVKLAVQALVRASGVSLSTAKMYLDTAVALDLAVVDRHGRLALRASVDLPEDLLKASTLVRLFRAWRAFGHSDPLGLLQAPQKYFGLLGIDAYELLRAASNLAQHVQGFPADISPQPALLLEMVRLWSEKRQPSSEERLFNSTDAFAAFRGLLFTSGIYPDDEVKATESFVRACRILSNRSLVRLAIVQYATERNQPYQRFRTDLGYIKALYHPQAFEGLDYAEPVQKTRRRLSSA